MCWLFKVKSRENSFITNAPTKCGNIPFVIELTSGAVLIKYLTRVFIHWRRPKENRYFTFYFPIMPKNANIGISPSMGTNTLDFQHLVTERSFDHIMRLFNWKCTHLAYGAFLYTCAPKREPFEYVRKIALNSNYIYVMLIFSVDFYSTATKIKFIISIFFVKSILCFV